MHYAASVEEEKLKELPRNKPDTCTSSAFDFILPVWITIAWLNRRHSAKYSIRFKDATENRELGGERSGQEETRTRKGKCLGNVMGSRRLFSEASHQNPKNRAKLTLLFFFFFAFLLHSPFIFSSPIKGLAGWAQWERRPLWDPVTSHLCSVLYF